MVLAARRPAAAGAKERDFAAVSISLAREFLKVSWHAHKMSITVIIGC